MKRERIFPCPDCGYPLQEVNDCGRQSYFCKRAIGQVGPSGRLPVGDLHQSVRGYSYGEIYDYNAQRRERTQAA